MFSLNILSILAFLHSRVFQAGQYGAESTGFVDVSSKTIQCLAVLMRLRCPSYMCPNTKSMSRIRVWYGLYLLAMSISWRKLCKKRSMLSSCTSRCRSNCVTVSTGALLWTAPTVLLKLGVFVSVNYVLDLHFSRVSIVVGFEGAYQQW